MKIIAIAILSILVLGFLFVQWANQPENIEALQKKRALDAAQKIEDEKRQAIVMKEQAVADKEIEAKKATMKLVIDERFANSRFEQLDFKYPNSSYFSFEKNEAKFSGTIYRSQSPQDYFIMSKEDYGDFTAETEVGIWGVDSHVGIFWDAADNGDKSPNTYQAAYSSPNTLYVETGDQERFSLGGLVSSENNQLIRVERFGRHVKVSVNGRVLFNEQVTSAGRGRVGLLIGHRGGIRDNTQSISIGIKHVRVWQ